MTDAEYQRWLELDSSTRTVLVIAQHSAGTVYVSNRVYITEPGDSPANTSFDDVLQSAVDITSTIDKSATVGTLELVNDGSLDTWLGLSWRGWPLQILLGDQSWPLSDFRTVVDGINGGIDASASNKLSWTLLDRSDLLQKPLQSNFLTDNETPVPLVLGKVFNIKPVLIDSATLTYQVNDGAVSSITVRDNGLTISVTANLSAGTFTLSANPAGTITADVVESHGTCSSIVTWVAARMGVDLDASTLSVLPSAPVGRYIDSSMDADALLNELLNGLGAYWRFNELGELQVGRIAVPASAGVVLTEDDVQLGGLSLSEVLQPIKQTTVKYKRNYQKQDADALAGAVSAANRVLYSTEYQQIVSAQSLPAVPLAESQEITTLLYEKSDAEAEATRRNAYRAVRRERWRIQGFTAAALVKVGDPLTLFYPRFGFDDGRTGIVTDIGKHLTSSKIELEILI